MTDEELSMQIERMVQGGRVPARLLSGPHETADGRRWVTYEAPRHVGTLLLEEWTSKPDAEPGALEKAKADLREEARMDALAEKHGVRCEVDRYDAGWRRVPPVVIVRVTRTQLVGRDSRWRRSNGEKLDNGIYTDRIRPESLSEVEARAAGRERVDFIAEGEAAEEGRASR